MWSTRHNASSSWKYIVMAIALLDSDLKLRKTDEKYELTLFNLDLSSKQQSFRINLKEQECGLDSIKFHIFKFNNRPRPSNRKRVLVISCFSEFGCETLGCMYSIPRLVKQNPGLYIIAMGWHGREFLYRHLVDEFWEIDEKFMWLRDYSRAFHHVSLNLSALEKAACNYGAVVPASVLGRYFVGNLCRTCGYFWNEWKSKVEKCPSCKNTFIVKSILGDIAESKKKACGFSKLSEQSKIWAKNLIKRKTVALFARGRKTYGRNLDKEFYINLIDLLKSKGYDVIWMGERQNIISCPVDDILDFSQMKEARDLEKTLALIANVNFTIQFWTASTRLAGIVGTPFLLFESPDQIYSFPHKLGQEGKRLELSTFGPKKLCISDYELCFQNQEETLSLTKRCIEEMERGDFSEVEGLIKDVELTKKCREEFYASM